MKSPYVSELQPNQIITSLFLVQHKDIRQKKTGEPYLSLVLSDRTGDIEARMWDNVAEVMETFERDDFLKVRGLIQVFQNRLQLTIHKLQKHAEADIDFTDYFPASKRNPEEMMSELLSVVRAIGNPHLRALVLALIEDAEIAARYKLAPAAKNIHHAYLGGLIEHVLSLCGLAKLTAAHYPNIDLDLLLTGVVLHDIGKVEELTYDRSFGYSSNGQLLGHIIIALRMIDDKLRGMPHFPVRLRTLVEHMVVSHHGELEFGSPKVPLFPEALLLHHLDNLDSKMECMRAFIEKDRHVEGCWTSYSSSLERTVLKKSRYLEDPPVPVRKENVGPSVHAAAAAMAGEPPAVRPTPPPIQRPLTPGPPIAVTPAQPRPQPRPMMPAAPLQTPPRAVPSAPVPASARPPQSPATPSLFGEKLIGALKHDKENS
jgi:3'-5' exoribonuclease